VRGGWLLSKRKRDHESQNLFPQIFFSFLGPRTGPFFSFSLGSQFDSPFPSSLSKKNNLVKLANTLKTIDFQDDDILVSPYSVFGHNYHFTTDGYGHLYLIWRYNDRNIYFTFSHDNGQTWRSKPLKLGTYGTAPVVSCSPSGQVYSLWTSDDGQKVLFRYSSNYGLNWSSSAQLNTLHDGRALAPQIASDTWGHIYALWSYETWPSPFIREIEVYFNCSHDYGQTWWRQEIDIDLETQKTARNPHLSCDNSGHVYIAWIKTFGPNPGVYLSYSSDYGSTWQRKLISTHHFNSSTQPQICHDSSGHVYIVWSDGFNILFSCSSDFGVTWPISEVILNKKAAGKCTSPQITCDDSGHVYVVWAEDRTGYQDIYFNYSEDYGINWTHEELRIDRDFPRPAASECPHIYCNDNGYVAIVWQDWRFDQNPEDNYPTRDIFFNFSADYGSTWLSQDIKVNHNKPGKCDSFWPQISGDSEEQIYIIWSSDGDLRCQKWGIYFNYVSLLFFLYPPLNISLRQVTNSFPHLSLERLIARRHILPRAFNLISWEPNPENKNICAYRIYRKPEKSPDSDYSLLATVPSTVFRYIDRHLEIGKKYFYTVTAVDSRGRESPKSEAVSN